MNPSKLPCVICDVDGTLAIRGDRGPHDLSLVIEDTPRKYMPEVLEALNEMLFINYVSGRQEFCRAQTELWLRVNGFPAGNALLMRKNGDNRKDAIVKAEMLERIQQAYEVIVVLDDRDNCIKMWREKGLLAFQVDYGSF